jgi:hypothetical protein
LLKMSCHRRQYLSFKVSRALNSNLSDYSPLYLFTATASDSLSFKTERRYRVDVILWMVNPENIVKKNDLQLVWIRVKKLNPIVRLNQLGRILKIRWSDVEYTDFFLH